MQDADGEGAGPAGYILQNTVFHARHLPTASKHTFTYPTLAVLLSLSALESHDLDLGHGRFFAYSDAGTNFPWARVTGIRPEAYLHDPESFRNVKRKSIREKLEDVLKRFGHDTSELEDAWMLTMPSYLGVEGINPLTVFYCYKKSATRLWLVILEVHNTFGERHVYVLPTGAEHEDKITLSGFTHSWTFPRQFHVSPFNDRSGFYKCSLVPPSFPPPSPSARLCPTSDHLRTPPSLPKILIQLWTPNKQLKLMASLRATSVAPLASRNLLTALVKYPFTLLLSFPRIAWQAFHLHYRRRLDVYARPEPRAVESATESRFDNNTRNNDNERAVARNEVQKDEAGQFGVGGGLGWQPEGMLEHFARGRVERFLEFRAQEIKIQIRLLSTNPALEPKMFSPFPLNGHSKSEAGVEGRELVILTRSPRAFLLILASPSPMHALLLVQDAEMLITISDEQLFLEVFSLPPKSEGSNRPYAMSVQHMAQRLRWFPMPELLRKSESLLQTAIPDVHPLDVPYPLSHDPPVDGLRFSSRVTMYGLTTFLALSIFFAVTYLEKAVFKLFTARFVKGTEPWGMWERAEVTLARRWMKNTSGTIGGAKMNMY